MSKIKIIDLEKPMHFTKEQSEWIKAYVIVKKQEARADVIDEFLRLAKERLNGLQMSEIQGEDMCPYSEVNNGECVYMNQDIGCSYCARQIDIEEIEQIAKQLKK